MITVRIKNITFLFVIKYNLYFSHLYIYVIFAYTYISISLWHLVLFHSSYIYSIPLPLHLCLCSLQKHYESQGQSKESHEKLLIHYNISSKLDYIQSELIEVHFLLQEDYLKFKILELNNILAEVKLLVSQCETLHNSLDKFDFNYTDEKK